MNNNRHLSLRSAKIGVLFVLAIFICITFLNQRAEAAPVAGFEAGRIIDDSVFANKDTMNIAQIQAFLNSKVPVCDTNGTQPSEYGGGTRAQWAQAKYGQSTFTCLRNYSENGKSSAQIIYEASQNYRINPQVIITLIQKEQGLVTDTWPLNIQYRSATGYGCPDTAACDSQYYGLTNQVNWSAKMFRSILDNNPNWYTPYVLGNNYIRWNPASSCGGTTVNILNRATQALYNYTPYQPNQAALNAGYGSGDSCSAYGNRNFYLYFTDWFGTTKNEVSLQKTTTNPTVYVVYDGKKHGIPSIDVLQAWGLDRLPTYTVSDVVLNTAQDSGVLTRLVKNPNDPNMLLMVDANSFFAAWPSTIQNFGFNPSANISVGSKLLSILNFGGNLSPFVYSPGTNGVYLVDNGTKHEFPSLGMLGSWAGNTPTVSLSNSLFNQLTSAPSISASDIYTSSTGVRYLADSGVLRQIPSNLDSSYVSSQPVTISSLLSDILPKSSPLTRLVRSVNSPTIYLLDNKQLHGFTSGELLSSYSNSTTGEVTTLSSDALGKFTPSSNIGNRFVRNMSTGQSFYLDKELHTLNESFGGAEYGLSLSTQLINEYGAVKNFNCGFNNSFIQSGSNPTIYMVEAGKKRPIGSISDLRLLNSSSNVVCVLNQTELDAIPTGGQITPYVTFGGQAYLLESGKRYTITPATLQSLGIAPTTAGMQFINTFTDSGELKTSFKINSSTYVYINNGNYFTTTNNAVANIWQIDTGTTHSNLVLDSLKSKGELSQFASSQDSDDKRIFLVDAGKFIPATSMDGIINAGYSGQNVPSISSSRISANLADYIWSGYIAKNGSSYWILDGGAKRVIPTQYLTAWQPNQATILSTTFLSLLRNSPDITDAIKSTTQSTIFGMKDGKKYGIPTPSAYAQSGLGATTIVTSSLVNTVQDGGVWTN